MGLTKPRAAQIFNLDYKQSTRVVTTTNITLTGGAPNAVDSVNLSAGDRVLVTGQTTASQNGLYLVTTLGSGSNGTWARTSDGNENGEIEAGMIVMVSEGIIYADTQWKLITDDPITLGTTALTFTQNYSANSISSGTSNVVINSNANVTVSSAGTANVLTVSNTGAFVSGVVSATGNVTGNYILGNGALLTGVSTTSSNINNGTSNVTVVSSNGNVTVGIDGTGNVAVFSTTGVRITGVVSATGNITGGNLLTAGLVSATSTITSAANVVGGNILTAGLISATGAVTGATLTGTSLTVSTGNVSCGNIVNTNANGVGNIGTSATRFNQVFALASSAQYADLAEKYTADADYTPGTVLEFGGDQEVTATTTSHSPRVAGIVSTQPSYIMNDGLVSDHTAMVSLTGRVPCLVLGPIAKGDRLVASAVVGHAQRLDPAQYEPGCIIGKALEDYPSTAIGTIEVAVGRF